MATKTIFDGITIASTSEDIVITQDEGVVSLFQTGLATGESIVIKQKVNGLYTPILESGAAIVLDEDNTNQICRGPAVIQLVKSTTAGNVSVDAITRFPS